MPSDKEEIRYKGVRIGEVNGISPEDSVEFDVRDGHFSLPLLRVKRVAEINCEAHLRRLKAEARKEESKWLTNLGKLNALADRLNSKGNFVQPSSMTQDKKKIESNQQTIGKKYRKIKKIGHGAFGEGFTVKSLDDGDETTFFMKTEKL